MEALLESSLMFAFGLAVFLVYLVMASQFEHLLQPGAHAALLEHRKHIRIELVDFALVSHGAKWTE